LFQNATTSRWPAAGVDGYFTVIDEGAYAEPLLHCATEGAVDDVVDTVDVGVAVAAGAGVDDVVVPLDAEGENRSRPAKPVLEVERVELSETPDVLDRFCTMPWPDHVLVGPTSRVQPDGFVQLAPLACGMFNARARSFDADGYKVGVVNALPETYAFACFSTPLVSATSTAVHTCSRCAYVGVNTYLFDSPLATTCENTS